jgi:hypothetical protein
VEAVGKGAEENVHPTDAGCKMLDAGCWMLDTGLVTAEL